MLDYPEIDILLRVHAEESHGTAALRCVELGISGLQATKPTHRSNRYGAGRGQSLGSATSQLPLPGLLSILMFGLPKLFVPQGVRQISTNTDTDSELLWLRVFARCLLFGSRIGAHPVSRVGGHSNRQFRALDHTGFVTNAPTLVYVPSCDKNVWELPL